MSKAPKAAAKAVKPKGQATKATAKPKGRPSSFSHAIADKICASLIDGHSLRKTCAAENMPHAATVCRWLATNEEFREQYARARELQADALFDETLDIADTTEEGIETTTKPDGSVETKSGDMLGHRKLRIDTRKWIAGKLAPKKYGDKLALTGGSEGDAPIKFQRIELCGPED